MVDHKKFRKIQRHSIFNRVWNMKGDSTFELFSENNALIGDIWRCTSDEQKVNGQVDNITLYKGDFVVAMVDSPGELNWVNHNDGKWDIIRKNPISEGAKKTAVDGGKKGEESFDNDYRYLCTRSGIPESGDGAEDGTAEWKKSQIMTT